MAISLLQAATAALQKLQHSGSLHVLWEVHSEQAALPAPRVCMTLMLEKFSFHLFLHQHVGPNAVRLESLLTLCRIPFRQLGSMSEPILTTSLMSEKKKKKHKHKSSRKRKREAVELDDDLLPLDGGSAEQMWNVELDGISEQCTAAQVHAKVALHMLSVWNTQ